MASKPKHAFADKKLLGRAIQDSFLKLNPKIQVQNLVMFLVYLSAILTTVLWIVSLFGWKDAPSGFTLAIAIILWFTCLFANFAEAIAEGRGKAQADSLRAAKKDVEAHKIPSPEKKDQLTSVSSAELKKGDLVIVRAGEQIPGDGEVVEGAASVDESAITGESAPVIREAGGDRSAVTGGTTVLSDWIVVQITSEAGESFLDQMIAMVEGAARKKTPNEIALQIFLVALSIIFILVTVSLYTYSIFSAKQAGIDNPTSITTLVALLVCLAPTTIGALLFAIGIAGMSRLNQANVLAMSGRAIEAAGDVDILMLDKTGTITLGNRQASAFIPVDGASEAELADAAQLSSLADETPEGRSVVVLAKEAYGIRGRTLSDKSMTFSPFTAKTRMSGVNYDGNEIRKGAAEAMQQYLDFPVPVGYHANGRIQHRRSDTAQRNRTAAHDPSDADRRFPRFHGRRHENHNNRSSVFFRLIRVPKKGTRTFLPPPNPRRHDQKCGNYFAAVSGFISVRRYADLPYRRRSADLRSV